MAAIGLLFMVTRQGTNSVARIDFPVQNEAGHLNLAEVESNNSNTINEFSRLNAAQAKENPKSLAIQNLSYKIAEVRGVQTSSPKESNLKYGTSQPAMPKDVFIPLSKAGASMPGFPQVSNEENTSDFEVLPRAATFQSPIKSDFYHVFGTDQSDVIEDINLTMKKHSVMKCPTFVRKENVSWVEVYFSNDYAVRSLKPKNAEAQAYADAREKTEKPYLSYSAGIRLGMGWNNGVALKSGVNYSRINEKFTYTDPNSMQIKTITIIKYIYDDQFNIIDSVKTTENVSIPGANTVTNYNHISLIDIPVLFQYTMPGKKRLSYSASIGPFINVGISQSGKILNKEGNSLISLDNADLIKRNIGLSFYGSFAINYQLTRNIQIAFEPNFRYIPASLTNLSYPLEQKYFLANVAAAFKYKI
ncbi:MAG: hypothetical protein IPN29_10175 [Saprospiraceae bacterium]|nr:hypothetical protein [Saprospiraceae bacterium]